jgi:uncharacterized membrane protein
MRRWLFVSVVLTALTFAGTLVVVRLAPDLLADPVPVHWDIHGRPDHLVPRDKVLPYLLISPGAMVGMILLTLVLPWLSPKPFDVDRFRGTYAYIMALVVGLFAYVQAVLLLASLKRPPLNSITLLVAGIFLFFALLGNVLGKVRRNFWIGVRTPWTLASETVWERTHRVAAWLFLAGGLAGFVAVLAGAPFLWCFVGLMVFALAPVPYSLVLYKRLERQGKLPLPPEAPQEVRVP